MKNCVTVENSYFGFWQDKTAKLYKDNDCYEMAESIIKTLKIILCD